MPKYAFEIEAAGLSIVSDELRRPGLLVKGLIPNLSYMIGIHPAATDARVGTIEKEETRQPVGHTPCNLLSNVGANIMSDQSEPINTERPKM
jgi:hypothetical protein